MKSKNSILFLTLRIFSATGGIEKVCRIAGKGMYELGLQHHWRTKIHAIYGNKERPSENMYFPHLLVTGYNGQKILFSLNSIRAGLNSKVVVMSHVNLLLVGYLIKLFRPSTKLLMLAHGIEVWSPFPAWKKRMLKKVDIFLPVSHFTQQKMQDLYGLPAEKFIVLNNCLDPLLEVPLEKGKNPGLLQRYGLSAENKILLTVARMSDTEHYKGYDRVISALPSLVKEHPELRYLLVGKYDENERQRLDHIIAGLNLQDKVIFAGFVPDHELPLHFLLADVFVMPSEKEGFGIVFIEAMFYGLPVIAGNMDGSVDALANGELGQLVDPHDLNAIQKALAKILDDRERFLPDQKLLMNKFSYKTYKAKLEQLFAPLLN